MARKSTAEAKIKVKAETQKLDKYQGQLSLWLLVLSPEDGVGVSQTEGGETPECQACL